MSGQEGLLPLRAFPSIDQETAFHEASHAVLSLCVHVPLLKVSLEPDQCGPVSDENAVTLGCTVIKHKLPLTFQRRIEYATVSIAGLIGQQLYRASSDLSGCTVDVSEMCRLLKPLALEDEACFLAHWQLVVSRARVLLRRYSRAVRVLARELLNARTVSGFRAIEIFEEHRADNEG